MPIAYQYDIKNNLLLVMAKGVISINEILAHAKAIAQDAEVREGFVEIIDLSETIDLEVTHSKPFFKDTNKWSNKGHVGSIAYAPTDLSFGVFRMMKTLMDADQNENAVPHLVTRKKAEIPTLIKKLTGIEVDLNFNSF